MALDYPAIVTRAAVLDVIPISEVWDRADSRLLLSFWPFSLLAQAPPFPERLISAAPDAVVSDALDHWGSASAAFPESVRNAYCDALRDEAHAHAICEEYRAAASIDRQHDAADITAGRRIGCPLLALWSATGGLATWYQEAGGPLGIWNRWAVNVSGQPVAGGHFFPEESPSETAALLSRFLRAS
jgi:haloacetate dehalogenase